MPSSGRRRSRRARRPSTGGLLPKLSAQLRQQSPEGPQDDGLVYCIDELARLGDVRIEPHERLARIQVHADGELPIAEIAGREIPLAAFQPVLNQGFEGEDSGISDAVKSRRFDQFLDEQVLLEEARRRSILASDEEVDRVMANLGGAEPPDEQFREEIRTTITVEKLARIIVEETAEITADEEAAYYRAHRDDFDQPAMVLVRQILLEDSVAAFEIHMVLEEEPERFRELAEEVSISPDRGRRLAYTMDAIPEEAAKVLADLEIGEVSPVIERPPHYIIFLMEGARPRKSLSLEEARAQIRAHILEQKGAGAMARLLADLRTSLGLRVHRENLPFHYVQEEPA